MEQIALETATKTCTSGLFIPLKKAMQIWHCAAFLLALSLTLASSHARQPTVSGKVADESGEPLPRVTVALKGSTQGTVAFVETQTHDVIAGNQITISITNEGA